MTQLAALSTQISAESASFLRGIEDCRGGLKRLIASLDPAAAATARHNAAVTMLNNGLRNGKIDQEQYALAVGRLTKQLDEQRNAATRVATGSGQMRSGMQQLSYQLNDVATGFATGQKPMMIFAQQGSQVIQSLQLMVGESKGFLGFLGGPWGLALTAAATALLPVIGNMDLFGAHAKDATKSAEDFANALIKVGNSAGIMDSAAVSTVIAGKLKAQARLSQVDAELKRVSPIAQTIGEGGERAADIEGRLLKERADLVTTIRDADTTMSAFERQQAARRGLSLLGQTSRPTGGGGSGRSGQKPVDIAQTPDALRLALTDSSAAAFIASTGTRELTEQRAKFLAGVGASAIIAPEMDKLQLQLTEFANSNKLAAETVQTSWVESAQGTINAIQQMKGAFSGGDFLDMLSAGFSLFGQLSGLGLFGSKLQSSFSGFGGFGGFRAAGGPVSAGSTYMVGERGPELFTPGSSGHIVANDNLGSVMAGAGRANIVQIVPSEYFEAVVDSRAAGVAAPMAVRAAGAGASIAQTRIARKRRQKVPSRFN